MDQQIKDLKDIINLIEVDTDLDLKGKRLSNAQDIIDDMIYDNDCKREGYFISVNDVGPADDFTRFYLVLGQMKRADAIQINKNNSDDSPYSASYNDGIREVSNEEYYLWYALACYSEMLSLSKKMQRSMRLSEIELYPVKQKISELRKQLGLNYKWEIVELYRHIYSDS